MNKKIYSNMFLPFSIDCSVLCFVVFSLSRTFHWKRKWIFDQNACWIDVFLLLLHWNSMATRRRNCFFSFLDQGNFELNLTVYCPLLLTNWTRQTRTFCVHMFALSLVNSKCTPWSACWASQIVSYGSFCWPSSPNPMPRFAMWTTPGQTRSSSVNNGWTS